MSASTYYHARPMSEQDPDPRRGPRKLFVVLLGALLAASLLSPGAVEVWADTRPEGVVRSAARVWARPVVAVSRAVSLDAPVEFLTTVAEVVTGNNSEPVEREPAKLSSLTGSSTTLAPRRASPAEPVRILAVGDSLMLDLQRGMERVLEPRPDLLVEGRGALGFGFTVPHWDWNDDVLSDYDRLVGEVAPDIVVVMLGANEFEGYAINGEDLRPGSDRWKEVLTERASEAVSHWRAGGAHVYWWSTPSMRDPRYLTDALNAIWTEIAEIWGSAVTVINSMDVLGDSTGNYVETINDVSGAEVPLRQKHGVHFHEIGADLLARQLHERLKADGWLGES